MAHAPATIICTGTYWRNAWKYQARTLSPFRLGQRHAAGEYAGRFCGFGYLAAYAQRLGATGLTFFDDDVINFFSPHAKGKSAIFLLAIGEPLKRKPQRGL
jgi:hypothetical protein